MQEEWKPIAGFEDRYEVSSLGRIRKYLQGTSTDGFYPEVTLCDGPFKRRRAKIHQLVMEAFVGPPPAGHNINHKNGEKLDPRLENLEYVTFSANSQHAVDTGLSRFNCQISAEHVAEIRALCAIMRNAEIARKYGISSSHVSAIRLGKRRTSR